MTGKRRSNHEGSIFKDESKGLWTAEIYTEGKKKRKTSKSQQVVREWLLLQRQAIKQGTFVFDESTTLSQFLDRFVTDIVKTTLKPKTISSYQFLIEKYIKPALGQLKPHHLRQFYTERLEAGLSKRTVQYVHALLRRALNFAFKLCSGTTKTGKPRYFFALQPTGETVEKIPDGYQIKESVNGVVSLVKERPQIITAQELDLIKAHLKRHPKGENYRADIKDNQIILYERFSPDFEEMKGIFGPVSPLPSLLLDQRIHEHLEKHARYSRLLRFILIDQEQRIYHAERWYDNGPEKRWVSLYQSGPLDQLAKSIIPRFGTNRFYALF